MAEPHRVARALREVVRGEVQADEVTRHLYASGASIFRAVPLVVVAPKDAEDVAAIAAFCSREGIPITGRGAGTSRAGQDVGTGVLVDFTRHLNRLLEVEGPGPDGEGSALVEPGLVLDVLNEAVAPRSLQFAPDPSSSAMCTVGGMIGNNAAGPRAVRYGPTRDHVQGLSVVLANGEVADLGPGAPPAHGPFAQLHALLSRERALIEARYPRASKNSSGYNLKDLFGADGEWNPHRLLVGSEGTLGLVTRARLRLVRRPTHKGLGLVFLHDIAEVGRAVAAVLPHGPAAVEVVNRTLFERVPLESALLDEVLARPFRFLLSIEVWEDGEERAGAVLEACAKAVAPWEHRLVADSGARQRFWSLRKSAIGLLHRVLAREGLKPIALLEDGAVPPERLPEYLPEMEALLCGLGVEAHFFGHAGNGHLHLNTPLDLRRARDLELADEILREGHRIIVGHGGVLSGEHGDGRLRTPYLRDLYGDLYDRVMAPLKRILDPGRILNPGIIVAEPGDPPWREMTRYGKGYSRHPTGTPFDGDEIHAVVDLCHGCGKCRHYCPAFAATGLEAATARSKANLLREVISGRLARSALFTPKGAEVFDLCLNCKRCLDDCPTGVDIPRIAQEARRLLKAEGEPPLADWIFKRHVGVARIGQVFGPLGERVREWPLVRAGMEHLGGIDRRSPLPVHQPRAFPIPYETAGPAPGPRVAYFPGCNAWFHDAEEGPAAIAVLEALGCRVVVPELRCCGVAQISLGYEDRVREDARENVRILAALVREGAEVVFSQPSCRLAVQADYPRLLPGPETDALRGHLHDVLGFVAGREELRAELERRAHPLEGAPVAFHQPCHARVLHEDGAARLLAQVLGPRLRVLPDNCCGLAGTFGLKKRWFDVAQAIGRPQVEAFAVSGAAEIATSCSSCQLGLGSAAGRPAHHPVFYLARALGARG